ncbi:hypothetical protein ACHWQZ_G004753 [Mnemiopsis leidyi]
MAESVKVIVRCRPMNQRENNLNCKACIKCDDTLNKVTIFKPDDKSATPKNFTFDGAYFTDSTTKQIYEDVGFALVDGVLEGYNGTVFAYGQTGCGKSFSMQGITDPPEQRGIIPRAFEHIFEAIDVDEGDTKYLVQASYLEIYNEEIRDLLGKDVKQRLELRESPEKGIYTQGLSHHIVKTMGECIKLMDKGWLSRSTGATLMNAESSRSHSIFAIRIEMSEPDEASSEEKIKVGKLNLVDLAGSERQGKTGATGERLREATKINLSLSALGNVISALVDGKSKHIPYRDSKLTRLLQDSLGGNTKTMMVACISPADNNYDETLSTLRYANRAKNIKNKPKINEDPKDALLREYAEEIARLKAMLEGKIPMSVENTASQQSVSRETVTKEIEYVERDSGEAERIKLEYEEKIAEINRKYEEEKVTKLKLNEELDALRSSYEEKLQLASSSMSIKTAATSDMAISPVVGNIEDVISGVSMATSPIGGEDTPVSETMSQSMDVQSISSLNTPLPVYEEPVDYTIQLSVQQAEKLTTKQLSNLVLTPSQVRILGYDGPVTPAHVACLSLSAAQIAQLDLTKEQRAELSPYQDSVLTMLDEQCEKLAYDQLLSYVNLLKTTRPLTLTFDQAQGLSAKQLAALVLSKEQSKACGGAETAQGLTLEQISELKLTPAQVAQLRFTDEQIEELDEDQYETATKVSKLLEKQELMCLLGDPKLKEITTVTLTSSQATQLDPELVQSLPLTDVQTKIIKEYKDSFTNIEVSDIDQLPLLPHQVKHLKVEESCGESLTKPQRKKVSNSMQTQTYVENVAIATMVDMEEGLTKTVTLSPQETATITKEQLAKIQVAVSGVQIGAVEPNLAEPLTLTPIEIQQMCLTPEQVQQIKAKKVKRIEKHGKIVKKEMPLSEAAVEISDKDQAEAIKMHQAALQKLQELQGNVVQAGVDLQVTSSKKEIKEKLKKRREAAEAKRRKLRKAMEEGNDEGVIEELFNLQMGEVEVRNKKIGKIKEKYEEKCSEIKDLTEEFQTQREDYLDSIRQQSQETKLLQQILEQIQPLLRRDSNYYNLDAIKRDCKWNPETGSWLLPPVMITRTKLPTPADIPSHKSSTGIQPAYMDLPDDMKIRAKLASAENSDYFKSTRAQRLLQENKLYNGGGHVGGGRHFLEDGDVLGRGPRNVLDPIDKRKKRSRSKQNF